MGFWKEFAAEGRKMYGIPEGTTAVRFLASMPREFTQYVRGEAVSAAYSARRTKGLQAIMDFQQMGGATREQLERSRGGKLPADYHKTKDAAHQALVDFPELGEWINLDSIG